MSRTGNLTRQRILDAAQLLILQHGFVGTSIDRIINAVGITKGAFFHHFPNKAALAEAIAARIIAEDLALLRDTCARAERLSDDPLQRVLNIIGLYADTIDDNPEIVEGCIYASYALQRREYPVDVGAAFSQAFSQIYDVLRPYFQAALNAYPARKNVTADELIESFISTGEGAIILAAINKDPSIPGRQFRLYKNYIELLFGT